MGTPSLLGRSNSRRIVTRFNVPRTSNFGGRNWYGHYGWGAAHGRAEWSHLSQSVDRGWLHDQCVSAAVASNAVVRIAAESKGSAPHNKMSIAGEQPVPPIPSVTALISLSHIPFFMDPIIAQIRHELSALADPEIQKSSKRFFKEDIQCYGIKAATVNATAKRYWKEVKNRPKPEIFALCEELYRSGYMEESFVVSAWAHALSGRYEHEDIAVFKRWIETYITNWASCDGLCNHTMGDFIEQYPEYTDELKRWTQSKNRWMRRASAVSLIVPAKHGKFFKDSIEIADLLLTDADDIVQKGYGWLLKEVSRKHTDEVFAYVMKNKSQMPRTALRYAIELMPKEMKSEAMKKNW